MKNAHTHVRRVEIGALLAVTATLFTLLLVSLMLCAPAVQARPTSQSGASSNPVRPYLTPTPSPTPPVVEVLPSTTYVDVGQPITVDIHTNTSDACTFSLYESTLYQDPQPLFDYVDPPTRTVGPPGARRYQLSARSTGTVTFTATLYGEWYCGFWQWTYLHGTSESVVVSDVNLSKRFYVPIVEGMQ